MADIELSGGKVWYVLDYDGDEYDRTIASQDPARLQTSSPYTRRKDSVDINLPYMGVYGEFALANALSPGAAISRDRIDVDAETRWFGQSREERLLEKVYPSDFKKFFRRKYREKHEDASIAFIDGESGMDIFPRKRESVDSIYDSSTDLLIVAEEENIDESFRVIRDARRDAKKDLQKLADKALGYTNSGKKHKKSSKSGKSRKEKSGKSSSKSSKKETGKSTDS